MIVQQTMPTPDRIWQRLMRGVDYIERNIGHELTLAKVAAQAALSEYHFHRLFRAHFGVPVMDYVRRRRITRAATSLLHSRTSILAIALDAGFESQAAFTRAFRRVYHTTPAQYRARGRDVPWLSSASISGAALAMFPGLGKVQPRLETIDGFDVAGVAASFDGAGRARIPKLWEALVCLTGGASFAACDRIGISENDDAVIGGVLGYMAAIRLLPGQDVAEGLSRRSVAGGTYLVFNFEGDFQKISAAYDYIFGIWMPGSRHMLAPMPSFTRMAAQDRRPDIDYLAGATHIWIPVTAS